MSVRYQIVCDGCGSRHFVKTLTQDDLPKGWRTTMGLSHHACSNECKDKVEAKHKETDGRCLLWCDVA